MRNKRKRRRIDTTARNTSPYRVRSPRSLSKKNRRGQFEALESRLLLAARSWIGGTSGNWEDAINWEDRIVPTAEDNAVIDVAGIDVTVNSPVSIAGIVTNANIVVADGSLTLTADGDFNGGLTVASQNSLTLDGVDVDLSVDGSVEVDGASLFARGGATLELAGITDFTIADVGGSTVLSAEGEGSVLSLPNLTNLNGRTRPFARGVVQAVDGGQIDLPALTSIAGPGGGSANPRGIQVVSRGANSRLNLDSLTSFVDRAPNADTQLRVENGGVINAAALTELTGVDVSLDDAANLATSQYTTLTHGSLTTTGGMALSLPSLTNVDESNLVVNGGSLQLPAVAAMTSTGLIANEGGTIHVPAATSYTVVDRAYRANIQANGANSRVQLPALETVTGSSHLFSYLDVDSTTGGVIEMGAVTTIAGPGGGTANPRGLQFASTNAGSQIVLSSLTSFVNEAPVSISELFATEGGRIEAPDLTELTGVHIALDAPDAMATTQFTMLTRGILELRNGTSVTYPQLNSADGNEFVARGGTLELPALTELVAASLVAAEGGTVNAPAATTYRLADLQPTARLRADGEGSQIELPLVASLAGITRPFSRLDVQAAAGGLVDLPQVTEITGPAGGTANIRGIVVESAGAGSEINLPSLQSVSDGARASITSFTISDEATINVGGALDDSGFTAFVNTDVTLASGVIEGNVVLADDTSFTGGGIIGGSLTSPSRLEVNGVLRITGDYKEAETSELLFDVTAETFDQLIVEGNATLAGTLTVDALNYRAMPGDAFPLAIFGSSDGEFATQTLAGSGIGLSIEPSGVTLIVADNSTRTWTSPESGAWEDPFNWSGNVLPAPGDTVVIESPGIQVTIASEAEVETITSAAPLLLQNGSLTVTGESEVTGGIVVEGDAKLQAIGENASLNIGGFGAEDTVNGLSVVSREGGRINFTNLRSLQKSVVDISESGTITLPSLTNFDETRVRLSLGATFALPENVTTYRSPPTNTASLGENIFSVTGQATLLDLSSLNSLSGEFNGLGRIRQVVLADAARIDLSGLRTIEAGGPFEFRATNGGEIDLTGLTSISGINRGVLLNTLEPGLQLPGELEISNAEILLSPTNPLSFDSLRLGEGGALTGNGTLVGNVFNNAGVVTVTPSDVNVRIDGDYTQGENGTLSVVVRDPDVATQNQFEVTGTFSASGTIETLLANGFAPQIGNEFVLGNFGAVAGEFTAFAGTDVGVNVELVPRLTDNALQLSVNFSTGPSVIEARFVAIPETGEPPFAEVTFSEPLRPGTFTPDDVVITGASGEVPLQDIRRVIGSDNTRFQIRIDPNASLSDPIYTVTIGPDIADFVGNTMNQDGDDVNGEAEDAFSFSFDLTLADLQVTEVSFVPDPEAFVNGVLIDDPAEITVSWSVTNGLVSDQLPTTWTDAIVLSDDDVLGDADDRILRRVERNGQLPTGESYSQVETILLAAALTGEFHIFVVTDVDNVVFENGAEENNAAKATDTLTVLPIPYADLQISNVTAPETARSSDIIEVTWTVENRGLGVTSTGQWIDRVVLATDSNGDNMIAEHEFQHIGPLGVVTDPTAKGSYELTGTFALSPGVTGEIFLFVDTAVSGGPFEFTFDDNNRSAPQSIRVHLAPTPDFTVTEITAPLAAEDGDQINVSWMVTNSGDVDASGAREDSLVLVSQTDPASSPVLLGTYLYNGDLAVGESHSRTESILLPQRIADTFRLSVFTNHDNRTFENNRANNEVLDDNDLVVAARPRPDLVVTEVVLPERVDPGGTLSIEFVVTNQGTAATPVSHWKDYAVLSLDSQFTRDDIVIGNFDNGASLEPGESYRTLSEPTTVPDRFRGEMFVLIDPDRNEDVDEFPNDGNRHFEPIRVNDAPLADLVVGDVVVPTQVTAGSEVEVRYSVTNRGMGETNTGEYAEQIWLTIDRNRPHPGQGDVLLATFPRDDTLGESQGIDRIETVTIPNRISSGQYFITPWVDPFGSVVEDTLAINENPDDPNELDNNNYKAAAVDVVGQLPDLQVTQVEAPETATGGDIVTINWTVQNFGPQAATGKFFDKIYLTDNPDPLAEDAQSLLLATVQGEPIESDDSYTQSITVELSPSATGRFFTVVTDDKPPVQLTLSLVDIFSGNVFPEEEPIFNRVKEVFEDNNVTTSAANVTPLLSNLVVTNVEFDGPLQSGESATFRYTVENQGPSTVWTGTQFWRDFIWLGQDPSFQRLRSSYLGNLVTPAPEALRPGESYTAEFNTTLPRGLAGDYNLFIHHNAHNDKPCLLFPTLCRLLETAWYPASDGENEQHLSTFRRWAFDDPNDNLYVEPLAVEFFEPDLRITNVDIPDALFSGTPISIDYEVINEGTRATRSGSWTDRFFLSRDMSLSDTDLFIGSVSHSEILAEGGSYTRTAQLELPDGVSGEFFLISYTDSQAEQDTFGLQAQSDIGIDNPGVIFDSLSDLVPFDMVDLTRRDLSRGQVEEFQNEGDNIVVSPITISLTESPDLQVTAVTAPESVVTGELFEVTVEVTNFGSPVPAAQSVWDNFVYLSQDDFLDLRADTYVGEFEQRSPGQSDGLGRNETLTFTVSVQAPADRTGELRLFAITDPVRLGSDQGKVFEFQNERNNELSVPLRIEQPPPADLVVLADSISALPENLVPGELIQIEFTVQNQSENPATGRWTDVVFLSRDATWDINDRAVSSLRVSRDVAEDENGESVNPSLADGELAQGESYTLSLDTTLPSVTPGEYHVIIRTDILNQIYEASDDENNTTSSLGTINISATPLPVGQPLQTTLSAGQERLFAIEVPENETLQVRLSGSSDLSVHELFLRQDEAPTTSKFDAQYEGGLSANLVSTLPSTQPGIVYVLVRGVNEPEDDTPVTLLASFRPFEITNVQTDVGGDGRYVTTDIRGAKFDPAATVELRRPGFATFEPISAEVIDATKIIATFDLTDAPHGLYDVKVTNPDGSEAIVPYRFLVERRVAPEATIGLGGPRAILAGDIGNYSVALQGVSNVDAPYIFFEFGIPEMGANVRVYGLDYLDITSNVAGDPADAGVQLFDANQSINDNGYVLTSGYAFGQQTFGFDGFNFNVQTYPGLRELNERVFEDLRDQIYSARPDLREAGVLDDGPKGLDLIQPGLFDLYVAVGPVPDFITVRFVPFQFNIVAAATALTREEFIEHALGEANQLRLGILDDPDASPGLLALAGDPMLFGNLFLASLEDANVLQPEGDAPRIREDASIQSMMSVLSTGILLGPAGDELRGGDLPALFESIREQYGHQEGLLAPTDGVVIDSANPIPVLPSFEDFDLGAISPTHFEAFNVYAPWVSFDTRASLSPEFLISGFNFVEDEPALSALNLARFFDGDASAHGAASMSVPFSSDAGGFLPADQRLPYSINFQNPPISTSYVNEVRVVQQLDDQLDARSFRLSDIRVGNKSVSIPANRGVYQADIDFTETDGYVLRVSAGIDLVTQEATWLLQAIDPITGTLLQATDRGLLPPNNALGDGFGFVGYSVELKDDVVTGDSINAQARVVFGGEAPEETSLAEQTIDAVAPTTSLQVTSLAGVAGRASVPAFEVTWQSVDDQNGSGLKHVTLYVAKDGGDFEIWQRQRTGAAGAETFFGEPGGTYEFLALATDLAGNREPVPAGINVQDDGSGANLGQLIDLQPTEENYGIAPAPTDTPSTNVLFSAAEEGDVAIEPPIRQPEFDTVLRPFRGRSFVTGISQSHADIGPMAIAEAADGSFLISGGAARNELYRVGENGGEVGPDATTALSILPYPIFDLAFDSQNQLWATTGGGPLLKLDPATGEVLGEFGDGLTIALTVEPETDQLLIASHHGIERFDPATETFTRISRDEDLRVGELEFDPDGTLWAVTWPDRSRVVKFTPQRRAETVMEFDTAIDSIGIGPADTDLEGLMFVSHNTGERLANGTLAPGTSELTMVDLASLRRVSVAQNGSRGDVVRTTADGRVLVSQSLQVDLLEPVEPPRVISVIPADGSEVTTDLLQVSITFSDQMFVGSGDEAFSVENAAIYSIAGEDAGTVTINEITYTQETQTTLLSFGVLEADRYEITVSTDVQSIDRLPMRADFTSEFTVGVDSTPPIAHDDRRTTLEDFELTINVLANDMDPEGDLNPTTVTIAKQPQHGIVEVDSTTGEVIYRPVEHYSGADSFSYFFRDLAGNASNEATVDVAITPVADVPQILVAPAAGDQDTQIPLSIDLSLNDVDGSESLRVDVSLPEGAKLSAGEMLSEGRVRLRTTQLADLLLTPAVGNRDDFMLYVEAVATESGNGDAASAPAALPVAINAIEVDPLIVTDFVVNDGADQRSRIDALAVSFNQDVTIDDFGKAIELRIRSGPAIDIPLDRFSYDAQQFALTISTTDLLTEDNEYHLRLVTDAVTASAGRHVRLTDRDATPYDGMYNMSVHRLLADFNGDFAVDRADFNDLATHYFSSVGDERYDLAYDLDENETIDRFDYAEWRRRFSLTSDLFGADVHVELASDTGARRNDFVTIDPTVRGVMSDLSGIAGFEARFNDGPVVDVLDQLVSEPYATGNSGRQRFVFGAETIDRIFGGPITDGDHTLHLATIDAFGNATNVSLPFTLDREAPTVPAMPDLLAASDSGASDADNITSRLAVEIQATVADDLMARLVVDDVLLMDTDAAASGGLPGTTVRVIDLPPGTHSIQAIAEDLAGNQSPASETLILTVDNVPPRAPRFALTPEVDPDGDGRTAGEAASIEGATDAMISVAQAGLETTSAADGNFGFANIPLQLGNNVVTVIATDVAGNTNRASRNLIRTGPELDAPVIVAGLANDTGAVGDGLTGDASIAGTVDDSSPLLSFVASLNGGMLVDVLSSVTGTTFVLTAATMEAVARQSGQSLDDGPNEVTIVATDVFLNASEPTTVVFTLDRTVLGLAGTPDLGAESDLGSANDDNITSATELTFRINATSGETVALRIDSEIVATATAEDGHATLTANVQAGEYEVTSSLWNAAGTSGPESGALHVVVDTTPPAAPTVFLDPASDDTPPTNDNTTGLSQVNIIGTAEVETNLSLLRAGDAFPIATTTSDAAGAYSFSSIDIGPGENDFEVVATDVAGNAATGLATIVSTAPDTVVPAVRARLVNDTGRSATDGITSDATIRGVIDDVSDIVSFVGGLNDAPMVDLSSTLSGRSFLLDADAFGTLFGGAFGDGSHVLRLQATDANGLVSDTFELPFTLDTQRPAPPAMPDMAAASDSGSFDTDNITNQSRVSINVLGEAGSEYTLFVEGVDVLTSILADGTASVEVDLLEGENRIGAQVTDTAGNTSFFAPLLLAFRDTVPPETPAFGLDALSDTRPFGDNQTNLENVRLVGTTEPGASLEFVERNETTAADENGEFEFPRVALAALGEYPFTVTATDIAGNQASGKSAVARVEFDPNVDIVRPAVMLTVSETHGLVGDEFFVTVTATDNVGVTMTQLLSQGEELTLTPAGENTFTATVVADAAGFVSLEAIALDAMGNEGYATAELLVFIDPAISTDTTPPIAELQGAEITGIASLPGDIIGTASDASLLYYTLELSSADKGSFEEIARGDESVIDGALGVFDPTMLANGFYDVRLTAVDVSGNSATATRRFQATGQAKIGDFTVQFTDVNISAQGFPLVMSRTYDSRQKSISGDFGYGWSMETSNATVSAGSVLGTAGLEQTVQVIGPDVQFVGFSNTNDVTVSVTMPSGQVERFILGYTGFASNTAPQPLSQTRVYYEPIGRTTSTLEALTDNVVDVVPAEFGPVTFRDRTTGEFYNPQQWKLTTIDGRELILNSTDGIVSIRDRFGNAVTFVDDAIRHSNGTDVTIERDDEGRVTSVTDPIGGVIRYDYDFYGDLVAVTDQAGNTATFTFDRNHLLIESFDPLGRRGVRTEYDAHGRMIATVDAAGFRAEVEHDFDGNREIVTDRLGNSLIQEYDERGNVISQTDAVGNVTRYEFDENDNPIAVTNALGLTRRSTYNDLNLPTSVSDPFGNTTLMEYNDRGQILSTTDPRGNVSRFEYDENGNLSATIDPLGNVTRMTYDESGQQTSVTNALGHTRSFTYDDFGHRETTTNEVGDVGRLTYDGLGRVLTARMTWTDDSGVGRETGYDLGYDAVGNLTTISDATGSTTYEYDAASRNTASVNRSGDRAEYQYDSRNQLVGEVFDDGSSRSRTYDAEQRMISFRDRLGNNGSFVYDALGREIQSTQNGVTSQIEYDAIGRRAATIDPSGRRTEYGYEQVPDYIVPSGSPSPVTSWTKPSSITAGGFETVLAYDAGGNLISTALAGQTPNAITTYDALNRPVRIAYADGAETSTTYDALGRTTGIVDVDGRSIAVSTYDPLGRVTSIDDGSGSVVNYTYDAVGNRTSIADPNGNVTRFSYDDRGFPVAETLPLGQTETREYSPSGHLVNTTDANGNMSTFEYENSDRLVRRTYEDGRVESFEYNNDGSVAAATDPRGTTRFEYDDQGRISRVDHPDGSFIAYTFTDRGELETRTTPAGTTTYTYGEAEVLSSVTDMLGNTTNYDYELDTRTVITTHPGGSVARHQFTEDGRPSLYQYHAANGELIESFAYDYNTTNRQIRVDEGNGRQVVYRYDIGQRLISELVTESDGQQRETTYTYDAAGNRLTRTTNGAMITYEYDANGRLLRAGDVSYEYDAKGNLTVKTEADLRQTFEYDAANRLVRVSDEAGNVTTFEYDYAGNRVARTVNGERVTMLLDTVPALSRLLEERDADGNLISANTYGYDLLSQTRAGQTNYLLTDIQGSTRLLLSENGIPTDSWTYDAFGEVLSRTGSTPLDFLFGGEQFDNATGHYHLRSRDYDPAMGRFTQADRFRGLDNIAASQNRYTYVMNDPVILSDPSGASSAIEYAQLLPTLLLQFEALRKFAEGFLDVTSKVLPEYVGAFDLRNGITSIFSGWFGSVDGSFELGGFGRWGAGVTADAFIEGIYARRQIDRNPSRDQFDQDRESFLTSLFNVIPIGVHVFIGTTMSAQLSADTAAAFGGPGSLASTFAARVSTQVATAVQGVPFLNELGFAAGTVLNADNPGAFGGTGSTIAISGGLGPAPELGPLQFFNAVVYGYSHPSPGSTDPLTVFAGFGGEYSEQVFTALISAEYTTSWTTANSWLSYTANEGLQLPNVPQAASEFMASIQQEVWSWLSDALDDYLASQ